MTSEPLPPATGSVADAYPPPEIAARVCKLGLAKVNTAVPTMVALAVLAGAFISLGALFYTVTITVGNEGPTLPFGLLRLAGGITFSLGLILVVVGGAELFTGNNLIAMAWAVGCVQTRQVVRNWIWVYLGNLLGACGTAVLVLLAGIHLLADGAVGETMVRIARSKIALDPLSAFARGVLCNVLVCLAVWLCMGARSVTDKIWAILFPISAFVACGFEHSVANMFFLPLGIALAAGSPMPLSLVDALSNLALVTLGNIIGGTVLVALVYWFIYLRTGSQPR
ncbi:MAG TPA: formate/nitrite transporter family protein [Nitrospira sp.]|nr:formate/nitrite transporter family protein [Nitrospira sp. NTP1]HQR14367.1 formate/nitrite transporter family protein [Nitrospira sp.]HQV10451.1 formate/nitrite transporter family protein [Nitrospira sp.]